MSQTRAFTLKSSIAAALSISALAGCANSNVANYSNVESCDTTTISQLNNLNDKLENAIQNDVVRWEPAEALVLKNEIDAALKQCDEQTSAKVIARAQQEVERYDALKRDAERIEREEMERKRLAEQKAERENQVFLAKAKLEHEQVETYSNLTAEQRSEKQRGEQALAQEQGKKSYMILSQLNNELENRADEYIVKKGDTLWDIASSESTFDDPTQWRVIYNDNQGKISNPDLIYPGQSLLIDEGAE